MVVGFDPITTRSKMFFFFLARVLYERVGHKRGKKNGLVRNDDVSAVRAHTDATEK